MKSSLKREMNNEANDINNYKLCLGDALERGIFWLGNHWWLSSSHLCAERRDTKWRNRERGTSFSRRSCDGVQSELVPVKGKWRGVITSLSPYNSCVHSAICPMAKGIGPPAKRIHPIAKNICPMAKISCLTAQVIS